MRRRRTNRTLAGLMGAALAAPAIVLGPPAHAAATGTCPTPSDTWEAVDLGFFGIARDINNAGDIVGETRPLLPEHSRPFVVHGGQLAELPPLSNADDTSAYGIDEAGTVAGYGRTSDPVYRSPALLWRGGQLQDIGTLGGKWALVWDIGGGTAVGQIGLDSSAGEYGLSDRAVIWHDGQVTRLPTNSRSVATGANETGQVVGTYKIPEKSVAAYNRTERAFVWESGVLTDLGTLGGNFSVAYGNNDLGEVVGTSADDMSGIHPPPFVWSRSSGMRALVVDGYGEGEDINNHGVVVGRIACGEYLPAGPVVWPSTDRQAEFLPPLAEHPEWAPQAAYAVNDAGVIVGFVNAGGRPRAVLWRLKGTGPATPPPPRPATYSVTTLTAPFAAADQSALPLTGDDNIAQVTLPAPVTLYGQTYTTAWVDTNGKVSFVDPGTTYVEHGPIPSAAVPNASVYPFWDDLVVDSSASVRMALVNGSVVIEWRNPYIYGNGVHNRITFSVAFGPDGTITMHYSGLDSAVERGSGATVGVENATGTDAAQFSYNQASLVSGTAIRFTP